MDQDKKNELSKKNSLKYKNMDSLKKKVLNQNKSVMYHAKDPSEKKVLLEKQSISYKQMETSAKKACLQGKRSSVKHKYNAIDSPQKAKKHETYNKIKSTKYDLDYYIYNFYNKVKEGPCYICSVCNRLLYKKSVKLLDKRSCRSSLPKSVFTNVTSFDSKEYICSTCHSKVKKGQIPCQAVCNKMYVDQIPVELALLEKLEQILIAQRIVFEKIIVMPKGQQKKALGAICNVPVNCDQMCKVLPRPPERSGIIMLKLKRKLRFRGHVYFLAVRLELIVNALNWLRQNNPLYCDVTTDINHIDQNLQNLDQSDANKSSEACSSTLPPDESIEETDDPLNENRQATHETCLQLVLPDYPVTVQSSEIGSLGNEIYNIAPEENRHPVAIMIDKNCEERAFPVLFPEGRFGYMAKRKIKLSPVKYFNARLLDYSG